MNRFLLIIITFLVLHVAQGQIKLTADEAISRAIQKSYDLLLLKNDSVSAAIDNSYAKAAFLPRINANAAILFNSNNQKQKLADGTTKEKNGISSNNITSAVNLNWTIFDGFKMFATRDKLAEFVRLGDLNIKTVK